MVRLIHRRGLPGSYTFQGNQFDIVDSALNEVRSRASTRDTGDFLIETNAGYILMDEVEVAASL